MLLHAFPLSSAMWDRMAAHLETLRDDTALLMIDFPGFGESTPRVNWSLATLPLEIRGTIERHTRKKVTVAGLSLGGYAAFEFYRMNPGLVRALVLSNTKAEADTEEEKKGRMEFAADAILRGADAAIDRMYSKFVTVDTDPEIAIDIRTWMSAANPEAIAAALRAMAARDDSREFLPLITVPSLVIASEHDEIIKSSTMREMARLLENSSFVEIASASHLSAVDHPEEWAEALASFLDRV